jgi:acetyl-CoA acyltransferase 2
MLASKNIFIVGAKRTPFGAFGGKLKDFSANDLAVISSKAAIAAAGVKPEMIDQSIFGNVIASSLDAPYLARHVALKSGMALKTPALSVNRLCGSGFEAVCVGAEQILLGNGKIMLAGGTESMSQTPLHISGVSSRWGTALGKGLKAEDALWAGLSDSYVKLPMGMTAEKLGEQYKITRDDCDQFALRSQHTYAKAATSGVFDAEITAIEISGRKGKESFAVDEHPRKGSTIQDLQKLKPVFKENGVVTAGSASGICDGAASLIVAEEGAMKANNLKPLSRVVAWHRVGCDPSIMGIGPVEAIRGVLKAANLSLDKVDLIEINEAFAAQYLACEKELGLDRNKCNTNGGAIAVGHPLAASGARILTHLTHELIRTKKRYAIGAACIGGGQGIAVLLENATH